MFTFIKQSIYIALATLAFSANATAQVEKLPTAQIKINDKTVFAEIAATERHRNYGLMHRTHMDENNGMLFVFEKVDQPCFWMKNTLIPLSIAFIDAQGLITDIKHMQPQTTISHCPSKPVKYALETNQGWYENNNIAVDDKICLQDKNKYPAAKLGIAPNSNKNLGIEIYCKQ